MGTQRGRAEALSRCGHSCERSKDLGLGLGFERTQEQGWAPRQKSCQSIKGSHPAKATVTISNHLTAGTQAEQQTGHLVNANSQIKTNLETDPILFTQQRFSPCQRQTVGCSCSLHVDSHDAHGLVHRILNLLLPSHYCAPVTNSVVWLLCSRCAPPTGLGHSIAL